MAITERVRFEIFKRDLFTCQYCGDHPPAVVLEIDHILPLSAGGENSPENLVTSCFSRNRGKANVVLTQIVPTTAERTARLREATEQLREYESLVYEKQQRQYAQVRLIEAAFQEVYPQREFTESFRATIRTSFLTHLTALELEEYIYLACSRIADDPGRAIKYFCGICWRKIKGRGES